METLSPETLRRILEVTDALGIHREAVRIPLGPSVDGSVRWLSSGHVEITAAAGDRLEPFLAGLRGMLAGSAPGAAGPARDRPPST